MNLLLLEEREVARGGIAVVDGRRALHAFTVLKSEPGDRLRVGIIDGPAGTAEVLRCERAVLEMRCTFETETPPPERDVLLLAVPRPRALGRCLEDAAALGFGKIALFRSRRVEKSWLSSHVLTPETLRRHLVLGLEQSRRTRLPSVEFFPLFRPFVEDRLDGVATEKLRFLAHLDGAVPTAEVEIAAGAPFTLAIGPEGGFVDFEVELMCGRGFGRITLGPHPQRVEVALCVIAGQLRVLREMAKRG